MDKTETRLRYAFPDSTTQDGTFIAQPESDDIKLSDKVSESETSSDSESEDDIKSLKERNKSADDRLHNDDDNFETQNWQRMDSFQERRHIEYNDAYRTTNVRNVSIDAMSINQNRNHIPRQSPGKSNNLPDPPVSALPTLMYRTNSGKAIFFDAVVVYAANDIEAVMQFVEIVKDLVKSRFQYDPTIEYYDQGRFCSSNVSIAEDVLNKASVVFIYLTKHVNNEYFDLFVDEAVSLSRLGINPGHVMPGRRPTDRQWILRPVHSLPMKQRDYKTPAGLVSIRGIDWYNQDSTHTKEMIISIMREARRIREEAERHHFLTHSPMSSLPNLDTVLAAHRLISNQQQSMANSQPFSLGNPNSGKVTIRFTPSARQLTPGVVQQPLGPLRPGMNVHQSPSGRSFQLPGQAQMQAPLPHNNSQPHQYMPPMRQSNAQTPITGPSARNQHSGRSTRLDQGVLRTEESRIHQNRHRRRHDSDSSDSESTSSDDESDDLDDLVPAKLKKKRNINIIGCRYVQIGSNSQVIDGPILPAKTNRAVKRKQTKPDTGGPVSLSPEATTCVEKDESAKQNATGSNDAELIVTGIPPKPQVQTTSEALSITRPARTPVQTLHSSVTEDNLDLSGSAQSNLATNLVSSSSGKSSCDKDLTLDQFSDTGLTKSDSDTLNDSSKVPNNKQLNDLSEPDKVLNLTLKKEEELQEYQLTVKGKKVKVMNDFDNSDSDNEKVLGDSDTEQSLLRIGEDSQPERTAKSGRSGYDSLSDDRDLFGDGPQSTGMLETPQGELNSIIAPQSLALHRQAGISFMGVTKSLQILPQSLSSMATSVNSTEKGEESDGLD